MTTPAVTDENGNKSVTYMDKPERGSVSRDTKE